MFVPLIPTEEAVITRSRLDDEYAEKLIRDCVHAIIVLGQDRNPIKKLDLNRLVFSTVTNYRISASITQLANRELNKTFGMRLYEPTDKTKYLLVNSKPEFSDLVKASDETCEELTVLYLVLVDTFVSVDEKLSEEDIQNSLKPLDLTQDLIKDYLDIFVKKLYLTQTKLQETRLFSWGPRAEAEIEPENFFNRFLDLVGDSSDKDWPEIKKRIDKLKSIPNR